MSEVVFNHLALNQTSLPPAADQAKWFALSVRARSEKAVAAQLQLRKLQYFLPLLSEKHRWSDRLKTVQVPLFPGYVFVHIENRPDTLVGVLRIPGALRFVGEPTAIPAGELDSLRTVFENGIPFESHQFLTVGERVRVRGGWMEGVEGVLTERKRNTLVLSVTAIQRSVAVSIEDFSFESL